MERCVWGRGGLGGHAPFAAHSHCMEPAQAAPTRALAADADPRLLAGASSLHAAGDRAAVDAQRVLHLRVAEATRCLKNGVLVEDDDGSVARYLAAHPEVAALLGTPAAAAAAAAAQRR